MLPVHSGTRSNLFCSRYYVCFFVLCANRFGEIKIYIIWNAPMWWSTVLAEREYPRPEAGPGWTSVVRGCIRKIKKKLSLSQTRLVFGIVLFHMAAKFTSTWVHKTYICWVLSWIEQLVIVLRNEIYAMGLKFCKRVMDPNKKFSNGKLGIYMSQKTGDGVRYKTPYLTFVQVSFGFQLICQRCGINTN